MKKTKLSPKVKEAIKRIELKYGKKDVNNPKGRKKTNR